jgi:hypothetical protein
VTLIPYVWYTFGFAINLWRGRSNARLSAFVWYTCVLAIKVYFSRAMPNGWLYVLRLRVLYESLVVLQNTLATGTILLTLVTLGMRAIAAYKQRLCDEDVLGYLKNNR